MPALIRHQDRVGLMEIDVPTPGEADVLIRILFAGICRTDLYVADGLIPVSRPTTLGHEFSGVVIRAPAGCELARGDLVTAIPQVPCGACPSCHGAAVWLDTPTCLRSRMLGIQRDGIFAGYVAMPAGNVVRVPSSMRPQVAAYTEPVAAAMAVLKAPIEAAERGLIVGENRIAELTRRVLVAHGFERVDLVAAADSPATTLHGRYDFAVEASATRDTLRACVDAVKPRGCVVLKSRPAESVPLAVAACVAKELNLVAVNYGSFRAAIDAMATGKLQVDDLFEEAVPLDDYASAFARARRIESKKSFFKLAA